MASLTNPSFTVTPQPGDIVHVVAKVNVTFSPFEINMIKQGLPVTVSCRMWGEDSGLTGADDNLFSMGSRGVSSSSTVQYSRSVAKSWLDEDWLGSDEIYARFSLSSTSPGIIPSVTTRSPTKTGNY